MAVIKNTEDENGLNGPSINSDKVTMKLDDILKLVGEFGTYQKRIFTLISLPAIFCAMHGLGWVLLAPKIATRCQLPMELDNATFSELPPGITFNDSYPVVKNEWSQCTRYDINYTEIANAPGDSRFRYDIGDSEKTKNVSCSGKYIYDKSKYSSSARIDFELVCDRTKYYTIEQTGYKGGVLVGSLLFGYLSDLMGRRPTLLLCLTIQVVFGIIAAFAPNFTTFVICQFLVGAASMGIFLVAFVMAMEMVGPSYRKLVGVLMAMFWTAGYISTALLSYLIPEWRYLLLSFCLPALVFASYFWILPESFRWLNNIGREDEAKELLRKVSKVNKVPLTEHQLQNLEKDGPGSKSMLGVFELFKYPRLLLRTLIIFFCWFVCSGMYYGLSYNTSNLGGHPLINFAISGAVEIPGALLNFLLLDRFGRKRVLCLLMLTGGIALVVSSLIPKDATAPNSSPNNVIIIVLAMVGKMCIFASFGAIYILSAELYPTVVRNGGMGASSLFARVGSLLSDYVLLLGDVWKPLPFIVFGSLSITSGLLCLALPETLGKRLPESIEDANKFGTKEYDNEETEMKPPTSS